MSLSILIVDDYEANTEIMSMFLELNGHRVTSTHDGKPALEKLEAASYDLVITDDRMGTMSGFELAAAIRANTHLKQMPILLVSAYEYDSTLASRMTECGINAFLPRPFTPDTLQSTVESLVKRPPDV